MQIRPATLADLEALVSLLGILFTQEAEMVPHAYAQRRGLTMILNTPGAGYILVAGGVDQIVGMCSILFTVSTAMGGRVGWLEDVVVRPEYRSQRIGSKLLDSAIVAARNAGCLRITLLTDGDNASAQRFYQRAGFTRSEMIPMRLALE